MSFNYAGFLRFAKQLRIETKEEGLRPLFPLLGTQEYLFAEIQKGLAEDIHHFCILKGRQDGCTTGMLALDQYWLFTHAALHGMMISDNEQNRDQFRATLTGYYDSLPRSMKVESVTHNRNQWLLGNRSRLMYRIAGTTRKGTGFRGAGIALVHATEVSSYGDEEGLQELAASLAKTNPNRFYCFESTARGKNLFYSMCEDAKRAVTQRFIFLGWWLNARNSVPKTSIQYKTYWDARLSKEEREWIIEVKKLYNYEIKPEQIAWWRWQFYENYHEDTMMMVQEHPPCVVADTRVGTSAGIIQIKDAQTTLQATLGKVVDTHVNAAAQIYKLSTSLGYSFRGTWDHPVFTPGGVLVPMRGALGQRVQLLPPRMRSGDPVVVSWTDGPVKSTVEIGPDLAQLIGIFMGDGSMLVKGTPSKRTRSAELHIACDAKDQDFIGHVVWLIGKVFGLQARTQRVRGCENVRVASTLLWDVFNKLGLLRNDTGPTMRRVHVPEFIFSSPREVIRAFLEGVFEADGYNDFGGDRIVLYSKYRSFLESIQLLLLAFGITCKLTSKPRRSGAYSYIANEIYLRANEARAFNSEIGFISQRKRGRFDGKARTDSTRAKQIVFEDVVSEVKEDGFEPVYNLTVEGDHAFDANGIKTHNTEHMAWVLTGSQWFNGKVLTTLYKWAEREKFEPYTYHFGEQFGDTILWPSTPRKAELKVWEKPVEGATYVIGGDPAYGGSVNADNFCCVVSRCYADGLDDVAEYASADISTYQFAWVICHLAGYYSQHGAQVLLNVEANGPGKAVMDEIRNLRRQAYTTPGERGKDIRDAVKHMAWWLFRRPDSLGATTNYIGTFISMNPEMKHHCMNKLRDVVHRGLYRIRSQEAILEMRDIIKEPPPDNDIHAEGRGKDDRVMARGLVAICWDATARPRLELSRHTRSAAAKAQEGKPTYSPVESAVANYFKAREFQEKLKTMRPRPGARMPV